MNLYSAFFDDDRGGAVPGCFRIAQRTLLSILRDLRRSGESRPIVIVDAERGVAVAHSKP